MDRVAVEIDIGAIGKRLLAKLTHKAVGVILLAKGFSVFAVSHRLSTASTRTISHDLFKN